MSDRDTEPAAPGEPIVIVIDPDDPHPWRTIRPQLLRAIAFLDGWTGHEQPRPPRPPLPEPAEPEPYRPPWDDPPEETDPWAEAGPQRM